VPELEELPRGYVDDANVARAMFTALVPWLDLVAARKHYGSSERVVQLLTAANRHYDVANQTEVFDADVAQAVASLAGWKSELIQSARKALRYETSVKPQDGGFTLEVLGVSDGAGLRLFTDGVSALVRTRIFRSSSTHFMMVKYASGNSGFTRFSSPV